MNNLFPKQILKVTLTFFDTTSKDKYLKAILKKIYFLRANLQSLPNIEDTWHY